MSDAIEQYNNARRAPATSQATSIEQSRATAEVQAMTVVAQERPRIIDAAIAQMREVCAQKALADRAFFRFSRGGSQVSGPSIHLARELARCWGNIVYGVKELDRDDQAGRSEMYAYAVDLQTNARTDTSFLVPHGRDTKRGRQALTDMRDIYENNANQAARRLRECIFAVIPVWFREEAQDLCTRTLQDGGGKPLAQQVADMIGAFEKIGVTRGQMETKLGRSSSQWIAQDVSQMRVIYTSINRGEVTREDEFPQERVTLEELGGGPVESREPGAAPAQGTPGSPLGEGEGRPRDTPRSGGRPEPQSGQAGSGSRSGDDRPARLSGGQRAAITAGFAKVGVRGGDDRLAYVRELVGRPDLPSGNDLTEAEAELVLGVLGKARSEQALQAAVAAYSDERGGGESGE